MSEPTNEEGLDFVGAMRLEYGNDDSILDLSELDGFLTAIVSGPQAIAPSQWLPALFTIRSTDEKEIIIAGE